MSHHPYAEKHCKPCHDNTEVLSSDQAQSMNTELQWQVNEDGTAIAQSFKFKNFYQTIEFVNAVAWIANQQKHHPDLEVSYNRCKITFTTHAAGGLTENDFICASRVAHLFS